MSATAHVSEREIAAELKLQGSSPKVARLSRKVLVILAATSSLALVGAVAYAMAGHGGKSAPAELYSVGGTPPDRLSALPKDYGDAPRLGPPLPGDLGKPILASAAAPASVCEHADGPSQFGAARNAPLEQAHAARDHHIEEVDAARTSHLFATDVRPITGVVTAGPGSPSELAHLGAQGGSADARTTSPERLAAPASPYLLQAGAVIPAALVTGIRSDLPGQIVAQVTENVFDSVSGRYLLVPQGARLIGTYESHVDFGQSRVLLAWTRLILPNGRSLILDKLPAGDSQGYAGLQDRVDHHWGTLLGAAVVSTVLGIGAELGQNRHENDIVEALRLGAVGTMNQVGQQTVGRALQVPPSITIRPGGPVRIEVTRDLVLEPYQP